MKTAANEVADCKNSSSPKGDVFQNSSASDESVLRLAQHTTAG